MVASRPWSSGVDKAGVDDGPPSEIPGGRVSARVGEVDGGHGDVRRWSRGGSPRSKSRGGRGDGGARRRGGRRARERRGAEESGRGGAGAGWWRATALVRGGVGALCPDPDGEGERGVREGASGGASGWRLGFGRVGSGGYAGGEWAGLGARWPAGPRPSGGGCSFPFFLLVLFSVFFILCFLLVSYYFSFSKLPKWHLNRILQIMPLPQ